MDENDEEKELSNSKFKRFLRAIGRVVWQIILNTSFYTCLVYAQIKFYEMGYLLLGSVMVIIVLIFLAPKNKVSGITFLVIGLISVAVYFYILLARTGNL